MDTSSYGQGGVAGGVLAFPDYYTVPNAIVVQQEQVNLRGGDVTTVPLTGSVVTQVTGDYMDGINQNYPT